MEHKDTYNNFKTEKEKYANRSRKRVIDTHTSPWVWLHRGSFCVLKISFSFNFGKKKQKMRFYTSYLPCCSSKSSSWSIRLVTSTLLQCVLFSFTTFYLLYCFLLKMQYCVRLSVQTTQLFGQANKMGSHRRVQNLHPT